MNKIISIILALTLMISSSPMDLSSANTVSNDIVIDNSAISKDNELSPNSFDSQNPTTLVKGDNTVVLGKTSSDKFAYYTYTASATGVVTITVTGGDYWRFYFTHSDAAGNKLVSREDHRAQRTGGSDSNTVTAELEAGHTILLELTTYKSYTAIGGEVTANFDPGTTAGEGGGNEGGETPDPSCEHKNTELRDNVDATCSEPGYTGDTWCKDCNTKIADGETTSATGNHVNAAGKWEYDDTNHWQICGSCTGKFNENAHTEGNEWLTDDTGHWKLCATCQKALTKTSHNYVEGVCICGAKDPSYCAHVMSDYEQTKAPTCTGNGIEVSTCTKCKSFVKTRFVKPYGHDVVDGACTVCNVTVGTKDHPAVFAEGDNSGIAPSSGDKHYYFEFTAVVAGKVTLTPNAQEWCGYVTIYNIDGTEHDSSTYRSANNITKVDGNLSAGQKIVLKISNYSGYVAAGGEITVNFQFAPNCTHGFVEDGTPATCEAPGRVGYTCATCNISYAVYTRALGHDMGEYIQTKAPTCTEKGEETSYCSRCDHKEYRDVAENGHTMGDYTQTKAPSCTAPGEKTATCSACGHTETQVIPANGHSSSNYIQTKAPTCTDPGEETATCSVCGQTDTHPIAALGHDTVTVAHKDATCTEDGVVGGRYCARCEAGKADAVNEIIPATGHTYVDGKCSCGAKDPNYVPEGTEGNPKVITEGEHIVTVDRYASYYYIYTAAEEGALTITVSGDYWAANVFRYNAEGKKLADNVDVRRAHDQDRNVFIVALEAGEKIMLQVSTYKGGIMPGGEITSVLAFAACDHSYTHCEDQECNNCNGTRVAPGHNWENKDGICASCGFVCQHGEYDDGFCTICGKECNHNWTDATCTTPKTCSECQLIDGEALGHDWSNKDGICVTCKCECQHGELTAVCPICGKAPEIKAVAQINGTQYASLQEAIAAAKSGETIVLLSDLELTHADAHVFEHETANQYKVMFAVAGKDITIDLNGKTISVTATPASLDDPTTGFGRGTIIASKVEGEGMIDWKADQVKGMLMAVIAVYDKGHLTLKDTAGTGGIQTTAYSGSGTSCGIVYSVLTNYSTDSSITIEAGKYEADFTKDSLVYTHASANEGIGNVGVVVKGGTFILGNAGEGRNGSTWIFNAKGQNERHVWITGGSFNTDIRHQYWIFEAQVSGDCALVKNGEMYTIVSAKYTVNEQYKSGKWYTYEMGYTTLAEAVAAAEANAENAAAAQKTLTITMLDNDTGAGAEVNGFNLIIDFNGRTYTLTSGGFQVTEGNTLTLKNGTLQVAEGAKIGQGVDASEAKVQYMP